MLANSNILAQPNDGSPFLAIVYLIIFALYAVGMFKLFAKAGQPSWAAIVPIYNFYILCKIVGKPGYWVLLMFIPIVGIVVHLILCLALAKSFGQSTGYGIGLWLLGFIFFPVLGFGDAQYEGPAG